MAERYTKISESRELQYAEGTPIVLCASALLADNKNDSLILQLKFRNLEDHIISSLKIFVDGYNTFNNAVFTAFKYQYLDINAGRGDEFGSRSPVVLPNKDIKKYQIKIIGIGFSDGADMDLNADFVKLPEPKELTDVLTAKGVDRYKTVYGTDKKVVPLRFKDIWVCGCGTINKNNDGICCSCGKSYEELKEGLDEAHLTYKAAAELLKEIPDYKDASKLSEEYSNKADEMRKESVYQKANEYSALNTVDGFRQANKEFESIKDWRDSAERIERNNQRIAEIHAEEEKRKERRKKSAWRWIISILSVLAIAAFFLLKDSGELLKSIQYSLATARLEQGQYMSAIEGFEKLRGYKDADEKILEAKYKYVNYNRSSCKEPIYYEYICELVDIDYGDAQSIYDEVYAWNVEIVAINDDGSEENMSSVSKYGKVYFIIKATGGVPDGEIYIYYESGFEGMETLTGDFTLNDGGIEEYSMWYEGTGTPSSGTAWLKLYDEDGNYLTEGSINRY